MTYSSYTYSSENLCMREVLKSRNEAENSNIWLRIFIFSTICFYLLKWCCQGLIQRGVDVPPDETTVLIAMIDLNLIKNIF
jgi:hypothetical protein